MTPLDRRGWLLVLLVAVALGGCSSAEKKPARSAKKSSKSGSLDRLPSAKNAEAWNRKHRPQGPQTFSNLLEADTWITDLDSKSPQTRITAAKQLGNMGKSAQAALPKLEKAAKDSNADVAAAAKQAIKSIRK
jgi:MFS superfamily sulfate permease-like transporter